MPESFAIECPRCDSRLRVSSSAVGKRLRCPRCESLMIVPAPPPRDEFEDFGDPAAGFVSYHPPPRRRRRKPTRKKQPKWVLPVAIGGGVLAGILFLGFAAYSVFRQFNIATLDVEEPLAYVTVGTELVVVVRLDEISRADGVAAEMRQKFQDEKGKRFMAALGIEANDISMIAVGLRNARDETDFVTAIRNGAIVLIQSKKDFSRWKMSAQSSRGRHAGKEYLKDRRESHGMTAAAFFANARTVIVAAESTIKKLLEIDRPAIAKSRFAFADFSSATTIAFSTDGGKAVPTVPPADPNSVLTEITQPAGIFAAQLRGLGVCRRLDKEISGTAYGVCADARAAAGLAMTLTQSPDMRRSLVSFLLPGAVDVGLQNLRIETRGSVVVVSAHVPQNH